MLLERIEISGFRGIKRLSLSCNELTTLIGENTWGKSSLLDALSIALSPTGNLYQFTLHDFHVDYAISHPQTQHLQMILVFKAKDKQETLSRRYRCFRPCWINTEDGHKIYYRISSTRSEQNNAVTHYNFLDAEGDNLQLHHSHVLAQQMMLLHPVLRLKDARQFQRPIITKESTEEEKNQQRIEKRINNTCRRLLANPGHVNKGEIHSSLTAMQNLIAHYFSFKDQHRKDLRKPRDGLFYSSHDSETSLVQYNKNTHNKQTKLLLLGLLNAYLQAKGPSELQRNARPLLIIEDPEGRLHPTHLARAWSLLQLLPMQKILTTNSGALLGSVPIDSIRRFVRYSDKTVTTKLHLNQFSQDELRRIGFHIRFHRSDALFARCWLLVEGETEVWLFNELANQCGYNLAAEGVQIIEFAQSGLRGLIKTAQTFAIDWHVVTDGDIAGKKYAQTVKNLLGDEQELHRLTELPSKDIEHYLYHNGFESFFRALANVDDKQHLAPKKIVHKVLKKYAKPDLALAIMQKCQDDGLECIPLLLRRVLKRVITMANGNT